MKQLLNPLNFLMVKLNLIYSQIFSNLDRMPRCKDVACNVFTANYLSNTFCILYNLSGISISDLEIA
jgi:hypothetical protein